MKTVRFQYGDGAMSADLPDSAVVVRKGETYRDPPAVDPAEAVRRALAAPVGMPPLAELARPGMKVVIAFPDRVKGGAHPQAHRRIAIPIVVETLLRAGVREQDITLICAMGLHRKNTREELVGYLGSAIVDRFSDGRLKMHDAEDPDGILDFGYDEYGDVVQVNREIAEADLPILIGHAQGNPYGGYSGGYKMLVTGLTTWRSIRSHHTPATMFRPDFLPAGIGSHMRLQFDAIGRAIEAGMGKALFVVDAVLGSDAQVLGVWAGRADDVQRESWKLAEQRTNVVLDMAEKADVAIFGLPRSFHYGPGMGTNPLLMLQAIGGQLTRIFAAFREGGVVIAPALCDGWFNDEWFPSYRCHLRPFLALRWTRPKRSASRRRSPTIRATSPSIAIATPITRGTACPCCTWGVWRGSTPAPSTCRARACRASPAPWAASRRPLSKTPCARRNATLARTRASWPCRTYSPACRCIST